MTKSKNKAYDDMAAEGADTSAAGDVAVEEQGGHQATSLEQDVSQLRDELAAVQAKAAENYDLYMRAKAEADNARRRSRIDVENAHKFGQEKLAKELLEVTDSLEKGLDAAVANKDNELVAPLVEGIELTYKLLLDTLVKHGIEIIDPVGQVFNPQQHEALTMQESADVASNHVITVIQKGFIIHGRVLRHAKVIVAK